MSEALKESIKEALRVVVLSIIPVAIVSIENGVVDPKTIAIVAVLALLRWLDSWLHQSGKAELGITRF